MSDIQEVLLNSNDRLSGTPGQFTLALAHAHYLGEHYDTVSVSQVAIKSHLYNVTSKNNRLYFRVTPLFFAGGTSTHMGVLPDLISYLEVTPGFYDETTLSAALENAILQNLTITLNEVTTTYEPNIAVYFTIDENMKVTFGFKMSDRTAENQDTDLVAGRSNLFSVQNVDTTPNATTYGISIIIDLLHRGNGGSVALLDNSMNELLGVSLSLPVGVVSTTEEGTNTLVSEDTKSTVFGKTSWSDQRVVNYPLYLFDNQHPVHSTTMFSAGHSLVLCSDMIQNGMFSSNAVLPGAMCLLPYNNEGNYMMHEYVYDHNFTIGKQVRQQLSFQFRTPDGEQVHFEGGSVEILLRFKKSK